MKAVDFRNEMNQFKLTLKEISAAINQVLRGFSSFRLDYMQALSGMRGEFKEELHEINKLVLLSKLNEAETGIESLRMLSQLKRLKKKADNFAVSKKPKIKQKKTTKKTAKKKK